MSVDQYTCWVSRAFRLQPPYILEYLLALPFMPIPHRKVALSFFRTQADSLVSRTRFHDRYYNMLRSWSTPSGSKLHEILTPFCPNHDPLLSGFMAAFTLAAPYTDYSSAEEAIWNSVSAEIIAGEEYNIRDLDYTSWFSPSAYVLRDLPVTGDSPDVRLSRLINRSFSQARQALEGRVLLPKVGVKSIGDASKRVSESMRPDLNFLDPYYEHDGETIAGVEKVYSRFGIELAGETEMRCSWKYNTLKPRTYFAQGPTVYHKAKYIQAIFNELVDCNPVTHRRMRFNLPFGRMISDLDTLLLTYDYSAFTSRLTESTRFIEALADFMSGTTVHVVDTFEGVQDVDVGDMIREYVQYAQNHPHVDLGRFEGLDGFYHRCGLLGVPGNISSCTLLHGLYLATLVGDLTNCKCVGDDALVLLRISLQDQKELLSFIHKVQRLGEVQREKFETWSYTVKHPYDSLWNYCKRPITRGYDHIIRGELCIVPSVEVTLGITDDWHVPSPSMESAVSRLLLFQKQLFRLLQKIHVARIVVGSTASRMLCNYTNRFVDRIAKGIEQLASERIRRVVVLKLGNASVPVVGRLLEDDIGESIDDILLKGGRRLPVNYPVPPSRDTCPPHGSAVVPQHAGLSLLRRLGYIEMKKASFTQWFDPLYDQEEYRLAASMLRDGTLLPSYSVTVLQDLPLWYSQLCEMHSKKERDIVDNVFTSGPPGDIPSDEEYEDFITSDADPEGTFWSAGPFSAFRMDTPDTGDF